MTTAEAIREDFLSRLAFPTDPFQEESMDALDRGANVLVTAPTGSGKTLVAAYAIDQALRDGKTSFYTTPLKALSNQKYREFVAEYGTAAVGLLTGDTVINPGAAIVVMTTEVLRNRRTWRPSRWWCSMRSTSSKTPIAGVCGKRSSS